MVLAPCILVTFLVVVEHLSVLVDADVFHRQNGIQFWTTALGTYLVNLRELIGCKQVALGCRHDIGCEEHVVVVLEGDRCLLAAVGGESGRRTALGRDDVHIHAAFAGRGEGYLLAVGAPDRLRVISGMGRQLACLAALGRNAIEVALVGKGDGRAIRRDGRVAHPQRTLLGLGCQRCCQEGSAQEQFLHINCLSL